MAKYMIKATARVQKLQAERAVAEPPPKPKTQNTPEQENPLPDACSKKESKAEWGREAASPAGSCTVMGSTLHQGYTLVGSYPTRAAAAVDT